MAEKQRNILLVNDDGITSPGIWAAADALAPLGKVWVVAPAEQSSAMGRSMPITFSGQIDPVSFELGGKIREGFAVDGSPAQSVTAGVIGVLDVLPDLVVSGINYGSNMGIGITVSGTVGAAMEGAAFGIPSLAVSLETDDSEHFNHSEEVDFTTSSYFTHYFAEKLLLNHPLGVNLLKVEVPAKATQDTEWKAAPLSTKRYFQFIRPEKVEWGKPSRLGYRTDTDQPVGSDAWTMHHEGVVVVTPMTLDMTARVSLEDYKRLLAA